MQNHRALCGVSFMLVLAWALTAAAQDKNVRVLYDFEDAAETQAIAVDAQGVAFDRAQDNGVTSGKYCCRMSFQKGGGYSEVYFTGDRKQGWQDYDYFAMDVTVPGNDRTDMTLEFFDSLSKNYQSRCSLSATVVPGKQTVLIPINRAKRNSKEGRDWEELEPQDKMNMRALTKCKFHLVTPKDHDLIWFVDNIRLLKEDALGRKLTLELPPGAVAYSFGNALVMPGFVVVRAGAAFDGTKGFTQKADIKDSGKRWPDPLTGSGVYSPSGKPFTFEASIPDGDYIVWLAAGRVLRRDIASPRFLLKVGKETLCDESPSLADLHGEKYLYRFLRTPYSERPNALWLDFIDKMYAVHQAKVRVSGGKLPVEVCGHQLSALIVVPSSAQDAFDAMSKTIRDERIRIFYATQPPYNPRPATRAQGDGAYVWFIPEDATSVMPDTVPSRTERSRKALDLAAAPGQNLMFRVAVTAFEDLGRCSVALETIKGPSDIPAKATRIFYEDYRLRGVDVREEVLIPASEVSLEKGITRCFWGWMKVPAAASAGQYTGTVTLKIGEKSEAVPVKLTIYPIALESVLPLSLGMWYGPPQTPDPADRKRVTAEQLAFMREVGFTGVTVEGPNADGNTETFLHDLAKSAGMGRHPLQFSQSSTLGMARSIARTRLGLGARVDQRPGSEFGEPRFKDMFLASARKYGAFLKGCGLPVAVQTVDEPRETPNPWNRNLDETNLYGDYLKEAGVANTMVTPMGDTQSGKDYTSLVDHHDIIATHAGKGSERLMTLTPQKGKQLWLYNCGMDRLSWGFYNWRVASIGRWEWHFRWSEDNSDNGYLNEEWYNPFTSLTAFAPEAPYAEFPGAMLFKSVFLTCADGITDSAYLVTLEKAMTAAKGDAGKTAAVAKAAALLERIKAEVPFLPEVRGIATVDDGALVGEGLKTSAAAKCEPWRREIAALILALK